MNHLHRHPERAGHAATDAVWHTLLEAFGCPRAPDGSPAFVGKVGDDMTLEEGREAARFVALNILSTLMAVKLGHVHDGMMVNLRADNAKLLERATGMVGQIAEVPPDQAKNALRQAKGQVKPAVLIAARGVTLEYAERVLKETGGHLRAALTRLSL